MPLQHSTPFRTSLYLRLADAVLSAAGGAVKGGWASPTLLCSALGISNALSRAAMRRWRRSRRQRLAPPPLKIRKLQKRSVR